MLKALIIMVPEARLELARPCGRRILSPQICFFTLLNED